MKLSIITINFNNKDGLEKTIKSVIEQTFKDFEYIIIDGGSTDGSADVIKKYSEKFMYHVSEKDSGIYNAMNKGIKVAKSEYLLFLNSGDYFVDKNILKTISAELNANDPIVYGNGLIETHSGKFKLFDVPEHPGLDYFSGTSLFHPASFIKKELFDIYGLYNEEYKIVSDWEFFIRTMMINDVKARKINFTIAITDDKGISCNIENKELLKEEIEKVLNSHFPPSVLSLIRNYKKLKSERSQEVPKKNVIGRIISKIGNSGKK